MASATAADLLVVIALLLGVVFLLAIAIWSIKRHRDPRIELECEASIDELAPSISSLTLGVPIGGNSVEIAENGAFFDALLADIAQARRSVHFETFLWKDGVLGRRIAAALSERARSGVKVRVLLDANGCKRMGRAVRARMQDAGCELALFHPWRLRNLGVMPERDHRKIAVLDGSIAWVGGHCIVDAWLGNARSRQEVRDLSVRLRGPIVRSVQSVFAENWIEVTGKLFAGAGAFPDLASAGDVLAYVASVKPEGSPPAVKLLHYAALLCAKKRIRIQNPYFLPDPDAIEILARAVRRGVDVSVMVPSAEASDMRLVQHAAHRGFQRLLDSGVRILEYGRTLLHQKVITVDGVWSAIGSSNFDDRSMETDDQIMLVLHDAALARRLERIFESDSKHCVELTAERWRRRGLLHRSLDSGLYLFHEVL